MLCPRGRPNREGPAIVLSLNSCNLQASNGLRVSGSASCPPLHECSTTVPSLHALAYSRSLLLEPSLEIVNKCDLWIRAPALAALEFHPLRSLGHRFRPGLHLLPGDVLLAEYEEELPALGFHPTRFRAASRVPPTSVTRSPVTAPRPRVRPPHPPRTPRMLQARSPSAPLVRGRFAHLGSSWAAPGTGTALGGERLGRGTVHMAGIGHLL